jgi:hypothetical protein
MNEPKVVQDKMNSKKEANPKKENRAMVVNCRPKEVGQ